MANEVTQLPSSLGEDPSSPEGSPSIATPALVERETNIMTQDELDHLRESHSFPLSVQIRLPEDDETIASTRPSEVAFYEAAFHGISRDAGVPRVPRTWGTPGKRCNKLPVLSITEQGRLDGILDSISSRNFFMIKEVLESKSFGRCFKLGSKLMASSGGNNREDTQQLVRL
ncbi:hypothetical protein Acr_24g0008940 [Actinidia rufa]|uniref:Uncharacterized protein n=1 Tax=Actinidia rufa TaxID=165716 RepID=A0A7J0GW16_9ERIC|nr:hypothetical protein Acr_24g0008940 [Actinidia rufa]